MGSLGHAKTELLSLSTWKWKKSSNFFNYAEMYSFAAFSYQNEFFVIGGRTKNEVLSVAAKFNPITEQWSIVGNLKFPRFDHKINVIGDKLLVIGGSQTFEHCSFINNFNCSTFSNLTFKREDNLVLYSSHPSKCKTG